MELILLAASGNLTAIAQWLNTFFAGFDETILTFAHSLHEGALGAVHDIFWPAITVLGNGGIFFILLGLVLLFFKKTRKAGFAVLIALLIGALLTNVLIKPMVERPRPYMSEHALFKEWWQAVGARTESEFSFPSGHATASFAAMGAFFAFLNKKWSWLGLVLAVLIGFSRNYIFVHYPSDILGGILVGLCSAVLSYFIVKAVAKKVAASDAKFAVFLREADVLKKRSKA